MKVFDLHCDTITSLYYNKKSFSKNDLHIDIEKLKKGDSLVQCFAIFDNKEKSNYDIEYLFNLFDFYDETVKSCHDLNPIKKAADIDEKKVNALLTMEDAGSLLGKKENLQAVYKRGVRMIALSWNYENSYTYPNSDDAVIMKKGLKTAGVEVIEQMNELGIIIDVSHMSYGCFYDVAKYSKKPFIASHSCCEQLHSHKRNLTDEMLRALANSGGVVGINFYSQFISGSKDFTYIHDVAAQAKHIADIAGIDTVALGSDFDGIDCSLEWHDFSGMNLICEALRKSGFTESETKKIMYKNALRVFKDICG